jgi:hypothetical protein
MVKGKMKVPPFQFLHNTARNSLSKGRIPKQLFLYATFMQQNWLHWRAKAISMATPAPKRGLFPLYAQKNDATANSTSLAL